MRKSTKTLIAASLFSGATYLLTHLINNYVLTNSTNSPDFLFYLPTPYLVIYPVVAAIVTSASVFTVKLFNTKRYFYTGLFFVAGSYSLFFNWINNSSIYLPSFISTGILVLIAVVAVKALGYGDIRHEN